MKYIVAVCIIMTLGNADVHRHGRIHQFAPECYDNATTISFSNGIVFDTRSGEPQLPPNLRIEEYDGFGYYLIQINGPIVESHKQRIAAAGGTVVGYVPNYTLVVRATTSVMDMIARMSFVRWTGIFQPAYKISQEMNTTNGVRSITVQLFPDEDPYSVAEDLQTIGFEILDINEHKLCTSIDAKGDVTGVPHIASILGVQWIQPRKPLIMCNNNAQWVVQTGWQSSVPGSQGWRIWNEGLCGEGIVLGTTDSGIKTEHVMFFDPSWPITSPGIYLDHRKIIAYKLYEGASFGDHPNIQYVIPYHGTHTACAIAGDDSSNGGTDPYDGVAKHVRLYFVDIVDSQGHWAVETLSNFTAVYDSVYQGNGLPFKITQHSGQYGLSNYQGIYQTIDASTDAYCWQHKDFLTIFPAGNGGPMGYTILSLALAKNALGCGGTQNGIASCNLWHPSSRGPTQDGRFKPNILSPCHPVVSADGAGTSGYKIASGTCLAATSSSAALGLVRQYLLAGYYPSGTANHNDSIHYQSSALLRSMAIVSADPNVGTFTVPDFNIGWGRIDIDSVLYFEGDTRKLIILDDTIGINTGQSVTDSFRVVSPIPLRICMAWTDTAAAPNANPTLINDLNLELIAPNGTQYRGNQYSDGQSVPNPADWDNINVEECCRINDPQLGVWHITVSGQQVVFGPQPFAYTITGDITPETGISEGTVTQPRNKATFQLLGSITHGIVTFEIVLPSRSLIEVSLFDVTGRHMETVCQAEFPEGRTVITHNSQLPNGAYFIRFETDDYQETHKLLVIQ